MQVILKDDFPGLGRGGDVVKVKPGYARNFLIPRGIVVPATERNTARMAHAQRVIQSGLRKLRADAEAVAERIRNATITLTMLVGDQNRLFGSVTTRDIEEALRERGIQVERRRIVLDGPIKELGEYQVPVRLHAELECSLKLVIQAKDANRAS